MFVVENECFPPCGDIKPFIINTLCQICHRILTLSFWEERAVHDTAVLFPATSDVCNIYCDKGPSEDGYPG